MRCCRIWTECSVTRTSRLSGMICGEGCSPMTIQCDVVVVGAGVAGVPAAVAAARDGADVLLVEQRAYPGGAGVAGQHRYICGLYSNAEVPDEYLLNGGLVREVCECLQAMAPATPPPPGYARSSNRKE